MHHRYAPTARNGNWRFLASPFSVSRLAIPTDVFTYRGFSDQLLWVDYAGDIEDYDGRNRRTGLAVPTTGRREVLLRGRFGISIAFLVADLGEERYNSTFDGVRWDSFRIEGVDRVLVDGQPVEDWERVEGNGVRFVVPVHGPGLVEVAVCAGGDCVVNPRGLEYVTLHLAGGGTSWPRRPNLPTGYLSRDG